MGRDGKLVGINTILVQGSRETPVNSQGYAAGTSAESAGLRGGADDRRGRPPAGRHVAGYCEAVEGVRSGDARVLTVLTGPRRRPRRVQVEFE